MFEYFFMLINNLTRPQYSVSQQSSIELNKLIFSYNYYNHYYYYQLYI